MILLLNTSALHYVGTLLPIPARKDGVVDAGNHEPSTAGGGPPACAALDGSVRSTGQMEVSAPPSEGEAMRLSPYLEAIQNA